jgi:hypothetical protein
MIDRHANEMIRCIHCHEWFVAPIDGDSMVSICKTCEPIKSRRTSQYLIKNSESVHSCSIHLPFATRKALETRVEMPE